MNENYTNLIYNGIEICLSAQLILLGLLEIVSKRKRNVTLGALCLLFAFSFIYNLYWPLFNKNVLANIILAGYKNLFYAPLIFLYIYLGTKPKDEKKLFIYHLCLPFVLHTLYLIFKFASPTFYAEHIVLLTMPINITIVLLHLFYLSLYKRTFDTLKKQFPLKALGKYRWFYLGLNGYLLLSGFQTLLFALVPIGNLSDVFLRMNEYINQPLSLIVSAAFIVFTLTESEKAKSLLFPKRSVKKPLQPIDLSSAQNFIQSKIIQEKGYTLPDFELVHLFKKEGVHEKHIQEYLKITYGKTLKDFIISQRINEFKELLFKEECANYKIESIAEMAGFNSRSTFYRNFKKIEGMSPLDYISLKK
ncbi:helix-turn-helix domain-containing protein [Spongiimicrobium salis]|uniref:helix-turn-helix domain-containing protein n=1 Tax=Spongiimicrobium salis TaxID=1667022 RepID=UPI00374CF6A1